MRNSKRGLGDNPVIILLGLIGTFLTIFIFITGVENIKQLGNGLHEPNKEKSIPIDCSLTEEIGPWSVSEEIILNPDRNSWIQADFWSPSGQLIAGYDEISVIFDPSLRITISGASGIAWRYDRSWKIDDIVWCTNKHIEDSWDIRHKKLTRIDPADLCLLLSCR